MLVSPSNKAWTVPDPGSLKIRSGAPGGAAFRTLSAIPKTQLSKTSGVALVGNARWSKPIETNAHALAVPRVSALISSGFVVGVGSSADGCAELVADSSGAAVGTARGSTADSACEGKAPREGGGDGAGGDAQALIPSPKTMLRSNPNV
jgi:hypothetical protein